ncbi:hypothetical protein [Aquabacterium sp.]|uniref:hypothetical protein n=1 Tax=Aquabacterium sp. TaxID=1872578 RepID=UPI0035B3516C
MHMSRYWITGCMALVLLAAGQSVSRAEPEEARRGWITRSSRFSVEETIDRIEKAAQERGIAVFAKVGGPDGASAEPSRAEGGRHPSADAAVAGGHDEPAAAHTVLVLAADDVGTPVLQPANSARIELPLQIRVERGPDGGTLVAVNDSVYLAEQGGAPPDVLSNVAGLPGLIDSALGRG